MNKRTPIADKLHSFSPIELKSGVVRMLILLIAFGFYMAFVSVSRTWIPVTQAEPVPTKPAEVDHQPIPKQDVVMTNGINDSNKTGGNDASDAVYVPKVQPKEDSQEGSKETAVEERKQTTAPEESVQPTASSNPSSSDSKQKKDKNTPQAPGLLNAPGEPNEPHQILGAVIKQLNYFI